ncbi:succinate-semialdehyde dehydrogenase [Acidobacteria bacterium Mor1]|nr:succinate-semialdehyde dehydrogenase [Acidobacteria bacterium Mor1]
MSIHSINPANGKKLREYASHDAEQVHTAIEQADLAFRAWRRTSFEHRAERMARAAAVLRERADEFALLMAGEMGKPLSEGRAEVEKCAWVCEYYAKEAAGFLAPEPVATDAGTSFVAFEPIGAVLAVMPWNFPFWQVFRFAAPALMAGNAGLLKHASNVPGSALAIEDVFRAAGFPEGLFRTLLVGSSAVAGIIDNPLIRAVTLTGSTPAGSQVASRAGARIKKTVLELGGSDAYVILEDADLEAAARRCATSRLINGGQSCIAAKRFVVVAPCRARFETLLCEQMGAAVMGDPTVDGTTLGPQARHDLRDELHVQVQKSIEAGARCLLGGEAPDSPGAFYPPTVLTGVRPGMPAYDEELFGPVAAIIEAQDEADAIRIANDSPFGLGAAVFTADVERGTRIATHELEAGACFVNDFVRSDPRLPFGGIKESGYGRELSSAGIREFVNVKTVWVQ